MSGNAKIPKEYLGAFKCGHRPQTREFIDEELSWELLKKIKESNFTDKKSMDALAYIAKFNNEFHKNIIKKGDPKALHNTDDLRKDCYARENARNRDVMTAKSYDRRYSKNKEPHPHVVSESLLLPGRNFCVTEDQILDILDAAAQLKETEE